MSIPVLRNETPPYLSRTERIESGPEERRIVGPEVASFDMLLYERSFSEAQNYAAPFSAGGVFGRTQDADGSHNSRLPSAEDSALQPHRRLPIVGGNPNMARGLPAAVAQMHADHMSLTSERAVKESPSAGICPGPKAAPKAITVPEGMNRISHQPDANDLSVDLLLDVAPQSADRSEIGDALASRLSCRRECVAPATYRLVQTAGSNSILVAVHALDAGLRVYARVGKVEFRERERLKEAIRALLAEHGLHEAQIVLDPNGAVARNRQKERA